MGQRLISFASGNLWRWSTSENIDEVIGYVKELDIDGVELTFATKEELYGLILSDSNSSWLASLDYVSIHAPFRLISASGNMDEVMTQMNIIANIYGEINARNIIIHPDELPPATALNQYDMKFSTENPPAGSYAFPADLERLLEEYPDMGLCVDVSHAYLRSADETGLLIDSFRDIITQIHLSGTCRGEDHQSLRGVTDSFLSSIEPIRALSVPIVIEEDIEKRDLTHVKDEIMFIRKLLG